MAYTGKSKFGAYDLDRVMNTAGSVEKFLEGLPDNLRDNAAASLRSQMQDRFFALGQMPDNQVQQSLQNRIQPQINEERQKLAGYIMPQAPVVDGKQVEGVIGGAVPGAVQPTDQFALILQRIRNAITKRG